jgi:DNA recombination protein RmuC
MTFVYILLGLIVVLLAVLLLRKQGASDNTLPQSIELSVTKGISSLKDELNKNNVAQVEKIGEIKKSINDELHRFKQDITKMSDDQIGQTKENLRENFDKLQKEVEKRLEDINVKVEARLSKGFEDTNKTLPASLSGWLKLMRHKKRSKHFQKM